MRKLVSMPGLVWGLKRRTSLGMSHGVQQVEEAKEGGSEQRTVKHGEGGEARERMGNSEAGSAGKRTRREPVSQLVLATPPWSYLYRAALHHHFTYLPALADLHFTHLKHKWVLCVCVCVCVCEKERERERHSLFRYRYSILNSNLA